MRLLDQEKGGIELGRKTMTGAALRVPRGAFSPGLALTLSSRIEPSGPIADGGSSKFVECLRDRLDEALVETDS